MPIVLEQLTFSGMGKLPVLPIEPHRFDYVDLEDTGGYTLRYIGRESADGKYWSNWNDCEDRDEYLVESLLESIIEFDDDYLASDDCKAGYHCCLHHDSDYMHGRINEWLEDNCEGYENPSKETVQSILDDLMEVSECEANYSDWTSSSNFDFVVGGVDIGEHEVQVNVADYDVLKALAARDGLEDALHSSGFLGGYNERPIVVDGEIVGYKRIPYVSHGSFFLTNNSGMFHWWGCSHQEVWDVCKELIDELEYVGHDAVVVV
jgi:hypothetical protein